MVKIQKKTEKFFNDENISIKESKRRTEEKMKLIKANRRDNTEAWSIIFTNIESEKSKVFVPDWLKYLFG